MSKYSGGHLLARNLFRRGKGKEPSKTAQPKLIPPDTGQLNLSA